ncbi:aftiphilin a isoform X2 [Sardina pilchardus]|uniref:aftiphilin a isoform X2 n=1 Tax=Sardina pilchardus TaxID=27697 RepID=UPI002E10EFA1
MEPDVIRMYSSSPPPMEDGAEEDDDEFGDFSGVPNSISLTEFNIATTFSQSQNPTATSPPELLNNGGLSDHGGSAKANGVVMGQGDEEAPGRTLSTEELKQLAEHSQTTTHTDSMLISGRDWTEVDNVDCNGSPEDTSRLTNGFAACDEQGTPPPDTHAPVKSTGPDAATECCRTSSGMENEDDFADFATFSNTNSHGQSNDLSNQNTNWGNPFAAEWQAENTPHPSSDGECSIQSGSEENVLRDPCAAGTDVQSLSTGTSEGVKNGDGGSVHSWPDADTERDLETDASHTAYAEQTEITLNGEVQDGSEDEGVKVHSPGSSSIQCTDEQSEEKQDSSGNDSEPETETETSFGRPLSTDALEEFGDFSTTGSVPSPPLQEETATPVDHSQMAEDGDEEEFGDFGDFSSTSGGFGGGQELTSLNYPQRLHVPDAVTTDATHTDFREDSKLQTEELSSVSSRDPTECESKADSEQQPEEDPGNIPVSDSFADFHSAPVGGDTSGGTEDWTAFEEQPEEKDAASEEESWATFGPQQSTALSEEASEEDWQESQPPLTVPPSCSSDSSRTDGATAALLSRLERLFQSSFPEAPMAPVEEEVFHLQSFLKPADQSLPEGLEGAARNKGVQDVWTQLQDIHNAFGLQHQWGGSHSNKMLLCSLGIDTRNILFTGQKKQPVIVPMYAASLGMLEPTKEPVKPVSAAEMIASIAQMPAVATEISTTTADTGQEVLPPVQFDWSSSGLTNPLDGVDPELYELTTAKLEQSGTGSRVADAFARLMSTVEKTSTSTRKPRKEENLSEEALKVISCLPDLSFMQAKVLMFPTSLTPLASASSHMVE